MHLRSFRLGAWLWILTGVGHTVTDLAARLAPRPQQAPLQAALQGLQLEIFGQRVAYTQLVMGFSLTMGAALALVGVLLLMVARTMAAQPERLRPYGQLALGASVLMLALALGLLRLPPPMLTFTLASLAFMRALRRPAD